MELSDFEWQLKGHTPLLGNQIILDFGKYHLSIVDSGYGSEDGHYEIGLFGAQDGVATDMVELPGITAEGDTVKGWLTEDDVNAIIKKLYSITATDPKQL